MQARAWMAATDVVPGEQSTRTAAGVRGREACAHAIAARVLASGSSPSAGMLARDPRFVDRAPAQIHATLLNTGTDVCRVRTLHRPLASAADAPPLNWRARMTCASGVDIVSI